MCDICEYAAEHGHWPELAPARTHCRGCHRSWRRRRELHCQHCHQHFASLAALDAHHFELGDRLECRDALAAGLVAAATPFGVAFTRGAAARA